MTAPTDVHLMIKPVDRIIPDFAATSAIDFTFHPGASEHIDRTRQSIRDEGCKSGLVLPPTPLTYREVPMPTIPSKSSQSGRPSESGIPKDMRPIDPIINFSASFSNLAKYKLGASQKYTCNDFPKDHERFAA